MPLNRPRPYGARLRAPAAIGALAVVGGLLGSVTPATATGPARLASSTHPRVTASVTVERPGPVTRRSRNTAGPVVAAAATRSGTGWWTVTPDGSVRAHGTARYLGDLAGAEASPAVRAHDGTVTGMAGTPDGLGYWLVTSAGVVVAFGDARFHGELRHRPRAAVVALVPSAAGRGYWLADARGEVFAFGGARRYGSVQKDRLGRVTSMAATPDRKGYWLAGSGGRVAAFGDATDHGGLVASPRDPLVGIAAAGSDSGYWLVTRNGHPRAFGRARRVVTKPVGPVIAVTATADGFALIGTTTASVVRASATAATLSVGATVSPSAGGASSPSPVSPATPTTPTTSPPTTTAPATGAPATTPAATVGVGVSGTHLTLDGVDHVFFGVDAYELGTDWGDNYGCGGMFTTDQLDQFFSGLPPDSLVRVWATQGQIGTNYLTHQLDWTGLDRVMTAAAQYHQYVILSLGQQGGTCDGTIWQDPSWYEGGYLSVQDPIGITPMSYWNYVAAIVQHFRDSPALAMWEPMNEAQASTCPGGDVGGICQGGATCPSESLAAQALRHFFDAVGGYIHQLDPAHPVEAGLLGGAQCGTDASDYSYVIASPGIDVASYHDYYGPAEMGGDAANGLAAMIDESRALGKPVLAGEVGVMAGTGTAACVDPSERASEIAGKIRSQVAAGASGLLLWNYELDVPAAGTCSENINPSDPVLQVLSDAEASFNGD